MIRFILLFSLYCCVNFAQFAFFSFSLLSWNISHFVSIWLFIIWLDHVCISFSNLMSPILSIVLSSSFDRTPPSPLSLPPSLFHPLVLIYSSNFCTSWFSQMKSCFFVRKSFPLSWVPPTVFEQEHKMKIRLINFATLAFQAKHIMLILTILSLFITHQRNVFLGW